MIIDPLAWGDIKNLSVIYINPAGSPLTVDVQDYGFVTLYVHPSTTMLAIKKEIARVTGLPSSRLLLKASANDFWFSLSDTSILRNLHTDTTSTSAVLYAKVG